MPLGATPSRWCVCQFHHFRIGELLLRARQPQLYTAQQPPFKPPDKAQTEEVFPLDFAPTIGIRQYGMVGRAAGRPMLCALLHRQSE